MLFECKQSSHSHQNVSSETGTFADIASDLVCSIVRLCSCLYVSNGEKITSLDSRENAAHYFDESIIIGWHHIHKFSAGRLWLQVIKVFDHDHHIQVITRLSTFALHTIDNRQWAT